MNKRLNVDQVPFNIEKVLKPFTEQVTGLDFYLLMDHADDLKQQS